MSHDLFFACRCPKCKRCNQVDVRSLGLEVTCRHCENVMVAVDVNCRSAAELDPIQYWIEFTESGAAADGSVFGLPQPDLSHRPR